MKRPLLPIAALCAAVTFTGCGSSSGSDDADERNTPVTSASPSTTAEVTGGDDTALPDDVCKALDASALAKAVGGKVTLSAQPGGDCSFQQADLRAISGGLGIDRDAVRSGGYDTYLSGLNMSMTKPTRHDVSHLGDHAAVLVGVPTMGSGDNLMAAGAVDEGDHLLTVTLVQGNGIAAEKLLAVATDLLTLLDEEIG